MEPAPQHTTLSDKRGIEDLARSGLHPKDVGATDEAPKNSYQGTDSVGYRIPYHTLDGAVHPRMYRVRLYNGANGKYTQPSREEINDDALFPYLAPPHLCNYERRPDILTLVEGEKKTAAACKFLGVYGVGIGGCANWRDPSGDEAEAKRGPGRPPLPYANKAKVDRVHPMLLTLMTRATSKIVEYVPDADFRTNENVKRELYKLAWACRIVGITLIHVQLPEGSKGLDDWLMTIPEGTARTAFAALPRIEITKQLDVPADSTSNMFFALGLECDERGVFTDSESNIRRYIERHPGLKGRGHTNTLIQQTMWDDEPTTDVVLAKITGNIQTVMPRASVAAVAFAFYGALGRVRINPVREYLDTLKWDGVPRLKDFAQRYLGSTKITPFMEEVFVNFLTGAAARATTAGTKFDHLLILRGEQGIGKTRLLRALFGPKWTAVAPHSEKIGSRNWLEIANKSWCLNIDELAGWSKSEHMELKTALSTEADTYRRAYRRDAETFERMFVCVATTNEDTFLTDPTGGRRFWIVDVEKADIKALTDDRDQLWAEAEHLRIHQHEFWKLSTDAQDAANAKTREATEDEDNIDEAMTDIINRAYSSVDTDRPYIEQYDGRPVYFVSGAAIHRFVSNYDGSRNSMWTGRKAAAHMRKNHFGLWRRVNIVCADGQKRRGYAVSVADADALPRTAPAKASWLDTFGRDGKPY